MRVKIKPGEGRRVPMPARYGVLHGAELPAGGMWVERDALILKLAADGDVVVDKDANEAEELAEAEAAAQEAAAAQAKAAEPTSAEALAARIRDSKARSGEIARQDTAGPDAPAATPSSEETAS